MIINVIDCVATIIASLAACISVILAYKNINETNCHLQK